METITPTQNIEMKEIKLEDAEELYKKEVQIGSRYLKMQPETMQELQLTGKVFTHNSQYGIMVDFELKEKTSQGQNRLISFKAKNRIVSQLIDEIKKKNLNPLISRTGVGFGTKYTVIKKVNQ